MGTTTSHVTEIMAGQAALCRNIEAGAIRIDEDGEIIGRAEDGVWVSLGDVTLFSSVLLYLATHPNPRDW